MLSPVPGLLYVVRSSLYVSLTNDSNTTTLHNSRGNAFSMGKNTGFDLLPEEWLPEEKDVSGAVAKAWQGGGYDAVVFAGMGEPTLRLETLLSSCRALRALLPPKAPIRLNTNGLGSEHAGRDISLSLRESGATHVSVSLNTADPEQYHTLMASPYGHRGLHVATEFARRCKAAGMEVEVTAVERPEVDVKAVMRLAQEGGFGFRGRSYHPPAHSRV